MLVIVWVILSSLWLRVSNCCVRISMSMIPVLFVAAMLISIMVLIWKLRFSPSFSFLYGSHINHNIKSIRDENGMDVLFWYTARKCRLFWYLSSHSMAWPLIQILIKEEKLFLFLEDIWIKLCSSSNGTKYNENTGPCFSSVVISWT